MWLWEVPSKMDDSGWTLYLLMVLITTFVVLVTFCIVPFFKKKGQRLRCLDVLQIIRQAKLLPVEAGPQWTLVSVVCERRVWRTQLSPPALPRTHFTLYAAYSKCKGSAQSVLSVLRDVTRCVEWDRDMRAARYVSLSQELQDGGAPSRARQGQPFAVQHDVISTEATHISSAAVRAINWCFGRIQGEPLLKKTRYLTRMWQREENGCCWLLEMDDALQEWCLFVAQPLDGIFDLDQCVVSVLCCPSTCDRPVPASWAAHRLAGLQDYFIHHKVKTTPLGDFSLPSPTDTPTKTDLPNVESVPLQPNVPTTSSRAKNLWEDFTHKIRDTELHKSELSIMQRFKTMIEEKKEWYEEKKRRAASSGDSSELANTILHHNPRKDTKVPSSNVLVMNVPKSVTQAEKDRDIIKEESIVSKEEETPISYSVLEEESVSELVTVDAVDMTETEITVEESLSDLQVGDDSESSAAEPDMTLLPEPIAPTPAPSPTKPVLQEPIVPTPTACVSKPVLPEPIIPTPVAPMNKPVLPESIAPTTESYFTKPALSEPIAHLPVSAIPKSLLVPDRKLSLPTVLSASDLPKPPERRSLLKFLKSTSQGISQDLAENGPGARVRQWLENSRRGKSMDTPTSNSDAPAVPTATEVPVATMVELAEEAPVAIKPEVQAEVTRGEDMLEAPERRLEERYRALADMTANEIMREKIQVAKIDIGCPLEEQAENTGGWIYCGLEKDVVILRKIYEDGSPIQSYLGKGLIPCPPKTVFEAIRNPHTRYTYDEMLKKMDVVQEFGDDMKILYYYHEVSQLFKKESRDFCVVQHERISGVKYIISLHSVDWPGLPETESTVRGKFLPSGWIIEPAMSRDNKLYSMVTYISQLELNSSKVHTGYLVEELAAKQPLAVAFLRQYLTPAMAAPRAPTSSHGAPKTRYVKEAPPSESEDLPPVVFGNGSNYHGNGVMAGETMAITEAKTSGSRKSSTDASQSSTQTYDQVFDLT